MKFIQDFFISILQFGRYPEFLKNSKKRVFLHGAFVVLLFWCITIVLPASRFVSETGGVQSFIEKNIPDFAFENSRLTLDSGFHFADGRTYIDIDTAEGHDAAANKKELRTRAELSDFMAVGDAEKVVMTEPTSADGLRTLFYKDLGFVNYNKSDLIAAAPRLERFLMMLIGGQYLFHLGMFFAGLVGAAYLGGLFAKLTGVRVSFGEIYKMAVYSRTLPLILKGILYSIGYSFPEYSAMSFLYTIFVITRAFRFLDYYRNGSTAAAAFRPEAQPDRQNGDDGYSFRRSEDAEERLEDSRNEAAGSDEEDTAGSGWGRIPTPKTPDQGTGFGYDRTAGNRSAGSYAGRERNVDALYPDPKATPKTPDGGMREERDPDRNADRTPLEERTGETVSEGGKTEEKQPAAEENGAKKPFVSTLPKNLTDGDLKPNDGWSFGGKSDEGNDR